MPASRPVMDAKTILPASGKWSRSVAELSARSRISFSAATLATSSLRMVTAGSGRSPSHRPTSPSRRAVRKSRIKRRKNTSLFRRTNVGFFCETRSRPTISTSRAQPKMLASVKALSSRFSRLRGTKAYTAGWTCQASVDGSSSLPNKRYWITWVAPSLPRTCFARRRRRTSFGVKVSKAS